MTLTIQGVPVVSDENCLITTYHKFKRSLADRLFSGLTTSTWNPFRKYDVVEVKVANPNFLRVGDKYVAHPETIRDFFVAVRKASREEDN